MPEPRSIREPTPRAMEIECGGGGCGRFFAGVRAYDLHAFPKGCGTDEQLRERGLEYNALTRRWVVAQ